MTNQRVLTFRSAQESIDEGAVKWRDNTTLAQRSATSIQLHVYDELVATLHENGAVVLHAPKNMSNTVRNRLNDVLIPTGHTLAAPNESSDEDGWLIVGKNVRQPYEPDTEIAPSYETEEN